MFGIQLLAYEQIKKILQYSILNNKVAHAYCFVGPDGVGKDAMAIEFAKTMNCKNPIINGYEISPCNECKSCKMASSFEHPNIHYIFALPSKKSDSDNPVENMSDEQIKQVQEKLAEKLENPYAQIIIHGANAIKINQIRDVKKKLSMSAASSGKRFVIISKADKMTEEAANAFLKTLEEPHEDTTIIITSSRKEALLQTILSRCQLLTFNPLPDELVASYLIKNHGIDDISAKTIAAFALGSVSNALDFINSDIRSFRDEVIEMLRTAAKNKFREELLRQIDKVTKEKDKATLKLFLKLLYIWVRDTYLIKNQISEEFLVNYDKKETIKIFSDYFNKGNYYDTIKLIEEAIKQIDINVAPQLILINLFIKMRETYLRK